MKKIFTSVLLTAMVVAGANAVSPGRSWDFSKWSDATLAQLASDVTKWRNTEKADGTATECDYKGFWFIGNADDKGPFLAAGEPIKELAGLINEGTAANSLAITYDLPSTAKGTYDGGKYLWLGGKNKKSFSIPNCEAGDVIEMYVESHSNEEGRGVQLLVNGTKVGITEGSETPTLKTYCKWILPEDVAVDAEGKCSVVVDNTNGCHVYSITINGGSGEVVEDPAIVAYVYDPLVTEDPESDYLYIATDGGNASVTTIPVALATLDTLKNFDVVVVSNLSPNNAPFIKPSIAFVPMLKAGTECYNAWGYGMGTPGVDGSALLVTEEDNALFLNIDTDSPLSLGASVSTIELGDYFADDKVLAITEDSLVVIHQHNPGRNSYIQLPIEADAWESADITTVMTLVSNAIDVLRETKNAIKATVTPTIKTTQKDAATTVEITAAVGAVIYYTLDGTDPTEESTVYTEAFDVTSDVTVKAFATADGYLNSAIATAEATIAAQSPMPYISVEQTDTAAIVTIGCNAQPIYFNFSGDAKVEASAQYTEPIVLKSHATVYAFSQMEGMLPSQLAEQKVIVNAYRFNTELANFDCAKALYYTPWDTIYTSGLTSKLMYYFSWAKSGQTCYTDEVIGTKEVVNTETGETTTENIYAIAKPETTPAEDHDWIIGSSGQVVNWSSDAPAKGAVGDVSNRYPATVYDFGATASANLTLGKITGEATAFIQTTAKYASPFEVITYIGNGNSSNQPTCEIQISADGETWTKLADCNLYPTRRCYMKTTAVYEGNDEVYVRLRNTGSVQSAMVYNIIINGVGELPDGIDTPETLRPEDNVIYNLYGQRVSEDYKGIIIVNGKKYLNR